MTYLTDYSTQHLNQNDYKIKSPPWQGGVLDEGEGGGLIVEFN
jgi:hypothetical protein